MSRRFTVHRFMRACRVSVEGLGRRPRPLMAERLRTQQANAESKLLAIAGLRCQIGFRYPII